MVILAAGDRKGKCGKKLHMVQRYMLKMLPLMGVDLGILLDCLTRGLQCYV